VFTDETDPNWSAETKANKAVPFYNWSFSGETDSSFCFWSNMITITLLFSSLLLIRAGNFNFFYVIDRNDMLKAHQLGKTAM